jgi:hypothetical protein
MTNLRETAQDRTREKKLLRIMSEHLGCSFWQNPNLVKYRLDGWFYNESYNGSCKGDMIGWAECKWYGDNKTAFCALNVPKYMELINISSLTKLPSYFIFREQGRWGYLILHNGVQTIAEFTVVQTGGTPKGRPPNPDDIEPLIKFDKSYVQWQLAGDE